ncbi:MAG: hypothetical protein EG826_18740 [Deltaproteobacteria bacterium]|nr:hypothetical protein [Deltaproteobacteria bacterium]
MFPHFCRLHYRSTFRFTVLAIAFSGTQHAAAVGSILKKKFTSCVMMENASRPLMEVLVARTDYTGRDVFVDQENDAVSSAGDGLSHRSGRPEL